MFSVAFPADLLTIYSQTQWIFTKLILMSERILTAENTRTRRRFLNHRGHKEHRDFEARRALCALKTSVLSVIPPVELCVISFLPCSRQNNSGSNKKNFTLPFSVFINDFTSLCTENFRLKATICNCVLLHIQKRFTFALEFKTYNERKYGNFVHW